MQACLAYCLLSKAGGNVTAEEASELQKRAREAGLRARERGDSSQRLSDMLAVLDKPAVAQQRSYSPNPEDSGIARDYPAYRSAHHDQLRTYIEKYVLRIDY